MSFDIYGNQLESGHCEVHPYMNEPYPCWECRRPEYEQQRPGPCEGCFYVTGRMQDCDNSCDAVPPLSSPATTTRGGEQP